MTRHHKKQNKNEFQDDIPIPKKENFPGIPTTCPCDRCAPPIYSTLHPGAPEEAADGPLLIERTRRTSAIVTEGLA